MQGNETHTYIIQFEVNQWQGFVGIDTSERITHTCTSLPPKLHTLQLFFAACVKGFKANIGGTQKATVTSQRAVIALARDFQCERQSQPPAAPRSLLEENPISDWPEASAIPTPDHTNIRPVHLTTQARGSPKALALEGFGGAQHQQSAHKRTTGNSTKIFLT